MICYDTRGHGSSSTPNGPYTVEQLGVDVVRLLDHLNVSKAAFVWYFNGWFNRSMAGDSLP